MWAFFWNRKDISQMAFASVYGYITGCMRMLCAHPQKYDAMELCEHCMSSSASIWGLPDELIEQILAEVKRYIQLIPEENTWMRFGGHCNGISYQESERVSTFC